MLVKKTFRKRALSLASIFLLMAVWIVVGCATRSATQQPSEESKPASIQDIKVSSLADNITIIEIVSSKAAPFAAFNLLSPPRAILDVQGIPAAGLSRVIDVNDTNVKKIRIEKSNVQAMTTRIVAGLATEVDYKATERGNSIILTLTSKGKVAAKVEKIDSDKSTSSSQGEDLKEAGQEPTQPRVFFKPRSIKKNQVLGVDFTMLNHGRSRLTVTTDKKVGYNLEQKGPKTLILQLKETTIPPLLLRRLDSSYFKGAVDRVKPSFSSDNSTLFFTISLRDVVPFHVDQVESGIHIDFGQTAIKPPDKKIVPVTLAETEVNSPIKTLADKSVLKNKNSKSTRRLGRKYTGAPMTMDFVNAEVTNILRLIGEISNLNIIWGNEVKGTVSMKLKNVPWDQALELVLTNNDLGMRHEGNIIWVTTKTKIAKIEAEEKKKLEDARAAERKKLEAAKKAKDLEPLVMEYLPIDFADADADIKPHIEGILTKRGKISIDSRTNTIILTDIASVIQKAKETVKRFDAPVKQIMIEARIVDATDSFSRNLGVEWGSFDPGTSAWRKNFPDSVEIPPSAITIDGSGGLPVAGGRVWGGSFSTNSPEDWLPNIGLNFARLTSSGLGALTLDANLALAESDGTAKVISAPKVLTSNGETAVIKRGDTFYLAAAENVDPTEVEAKLELTVTPFVTYNNYVNMEIKVTDEKGGGDNASKTGKEIATKLMVKSGETIVIGGIYTENKKEEISGIPWLKDVPVLGWLFKAERKVSSKTELLIFITPRVVSY